MYTNAKLERAKGTAQECFKKPVAASKQGVKQDKRANQTPISSSDNSRATKGGAVVNKV